MNCRFCKQEATASTGGDWHRCLTCEVWTLLGKSYIKEDRQILRESYRRYIKEYMYILDVDYANQTASVQPFNGPGSKHQSPGKIWEGKFITITDPKTV